MSNYPNLVQRIFWINTDNFGSCRAAYQVELPGDGRPSGKQFLCVWDTDNRTVIKIDMMRAEESETSDHIILMDRLYDAFNAGLDDHAEEILKGYLDTMDPLSDVREVRTVEQNDSTYRIEVQTVFGCGHTSMLSTTIADVGPDVAMAINELCPSCERELTDMEIDEYDNGFHCENLGTKDCGSCNDCSMVPVKHNPIREFMLNLYWKIHGIFYNDMPF